MEILHISAECYPAAKAGGLGDVVGALPKYLNEQGTSAAVIIPKYHTPWVLKQEFKPVFEGKAMLDQQSIPFAVERLADDTLGFPFFVVDIPGKFDRPGIYADPSGGWYRDEVSRFLSFQQAVLRWLVSLKKRPRIIHCHDHHTGLVPFLLKYGLEFRALRKIPSIFTIHNGEYHGAFSWELSRLLPYYEASNSGFLDWDHRINPLASAIKCCWAFSTVSPHYLDELKAFANGLEGLIRTESHKARGILNGIDTQVWDPGTDPLLPVNFQEDLKAYKSTNKQMLARQFNVDLNLPVYTFIGRLVREKGADLLPDLISQVLNSGLQVAFLILGTGEPHLHEALRRLLYPYQGRLDIALEYNEGLAHHLYAGSDFLLMPSRVEPCGLNQMYAMRYGTVPVVRSVGGLYDTVIDIGEDKNRGRGIRFDGFSVDEAHHAIYRGYELYQEPKRWGATLERIMGVDFSWERSAAAYQALYDQWT